MEGELIENRLIVLWWLLKIGVRIKSEHKLFSQCILGHDLPRDNSNIHIHTGHNS